MHLRAQRVMRPQAAGDAPQGPGGHGSQGAAGHGASGPRRLCSSGSWGAWILGPCREPSGPRRLRTPPRADDHALRAPQATLLRVWGMDLRVPQGQRPQGPRLRSSGPRRHGAAGYAPQGPGYALGAPQARRSSGCWGTLQGPSHITSGAGEQAPPVHKQGRAPVRAFICS